MNARTCHRPGPPGHLHCDVRDPPPPHGCGGTAHAHRHVFTGVITMGRRWPLFSDPNIVLLGALFVMGEGLVRTGVAQRLGDWLIRKAGSSVNRLLILLMGVVGLLGAFASSTGVVAIFIPGRAAHCEKAPAPPPQITAMPLSVAALISGMMTLLRPRSEPVRRQ